MEWIHDLRGTRNTSQTLSSKKLCCINCGQSINFMHCSGYRSSDLTIGKKKSKVCQSEDKGCFQPDQSRYLSGWVYFSNTAFINSVMQYAWKLIEEICGRQEARSACAQRGLIYVWSYNCFKWIERGGTYLLSCWISEMYCPSKCTITSL